MMDKELAGILKVQADICELALSYSKCLAVVRNHRELKTELDLMAHVPQLLEEASKLRRAASPNVGGVQDKRWTADGHLVKYDTPGMHNGLIEYLCSRALDCVSIDGAPVEHVKYDIYYEDGRAGCICDSYLRAGESEAPFYEIGELLHLDDMLKEPKLKSLLRHVAITFMCDALFYNEDRHLGNLIYIEGLEPRLAPVFDMGNSLCFVGTPNYERYEPSPYLKEQLDWALSVLGRSAVYYDFMRFNNTVSRCVQPYGQRLTEEYISRMEECAYSNFLLNYVGVN